MSIANYQLVYLSEDTKVYVSKAKDFVGKKSWWANTCTRGLPYCNIAWNNRDSKVNTFDIT